MATNDIGRVTPIWRGLYAGTTAYELNDIVLDASGTVWWHKGLEITVGVAPAEGGVWGAVIDMTVFGAAIREALETAQAAVRAAEDAETGVEEDVQRAEAAAESSEQSATAASESVSSIGAYAQAAEEAASQAAGSASSASGSAASAGNDRSAAQSARAGAEAAQTAAQNARSGAEAAQTAAQTAKTGAEAAQTAAQNAQAGAEAAQAATIAAKNAAIAEIDGVFAAEVAQGVAAIEQKGEDTLESIPDDYTALAGRVSDMEEEIASAAPVIITETSGSMAVFSDGADNRPITGLRVNIVPGIGRRGTVGPTNPRPLTGYTTAAITQAGKNLFDKDNFTTLKISCTASSGSTTGTVAGVLQDVAWMELTGGRTYAIRCSTRSTSAFRVTATAERPVATNDYKTPVLLTVSDPSADEIIFEAPADMKWIGFTLRNNSATDVTTIDAAVAGLQVEIADTGTAFETFDGDHLEVNLPVGAGTVYAGTLDVVAGTLRVTHVYMEFDGTTETWELNTTGTSPYFKTSTISGSLPKNNSFGWCSHFNWANITNSNQVIGVGVIYGSNQVVAFRPGADIATTVAELTAWLAAQDAAGTPLQVVYPLNTPVDYTLTHEELNTLLGLNRIWANCGTVEVEYPADTKLFIDVQNSEDRAMMAAPEPIMRATRNYTAGEYLSVGAALYRVTAAIANGGAITPGTNVEQTTVGEELTALKNLII